MQVCSTCSTTLPPPPSVEIATDLVEALEAAYRPGAACIEQVLDARRRLFLYTWRLRHLVLALEDKGRKNGRLYRRALAEALRRGALAAVPGIVAAGIKGLLFPPAAVAEVSQAFLHGLSEATKRKPWEPPPE